MTFEKKYEEFKGESPGNIWREPVLYGEGTADTETTLRLACVCSAEEPRGFCGVRDMRTVGGGIRVESRSDRNATFAQGEMGTIGRL